MYQIDNSTAVVTIPASTAAGTPGFFTDGNPATGVPATIMPAEYQNMLMMEIINVLAAAGVTPSKSNFTQLLTAIKAVGRQGVILADTGTAGAYAAANTPALTALPATGYSQRLNIAHANTGASTYAPDGLAAKPIYGLALQPLQGGELPVGVAILMYLVQAGVNGGNGAWILIESLGGASQVATATQSQHAAQYGQIPFKNMAIYKLIGGVQNVSINGGAFTTTGATSFTYPTSGVVRKRVWGGGGGGGGVSGTSACASGGNAGGYAEGMYAAAPGTVDAVTVAGGGAAGAAGGNGGSGGTSTAGVGVSATGGGGGIGTNFGPVAANTATFGNGVGGTLNLPGQGALGSMQIGSAYFSSTGGGSFGSPPTPFGISAGGGVNGLPPGGGAGGAAGGTFAGGKGADGLVIYEY